MKNIKSIFFLVLAICYSCQSKSSKKHDEITVVASIRDTITEKSIWETCSFSNREFAYKIDSCNCGDVIATHDTIFINLSHQLGGEIQARLLSISKPNCDSTFFILMKHQNRYYTSSMGPDLVYDDWKLYNSEYDTIKYNPQLNGFFIDTISEDEQRKFPKFDTLDFYMAYRRAVGNNLNAGYVPNIAKAALYREYKNDRKNIKDIIEKSSVELCRIILVVRQRDQEYKVIVFTYAHIG